MFLLEHNFMIFKMAYQGIDASKGRIEYPRSPSTHQKIGALPNYEQAELVVRAQMGDMDAKEKITGGLQKMVMKIARRELMRRGHDPSGDLLGDMINEGNIGLLTAIEKYDPDMINPETGTPFAITTYSTHWIRQQIGRALGNEYGQMARIPIYEQETMERVRKTEERLRALSGKNPRISDIAAELGFSEEGVKRAYSLMNADVLSLDYSFGGGENTKLGEIIPDEKSSTETIYGGREVSDALQRALEKAVESTTIKPGDVELLKQHFGFDGSGRTREDVANSFGISKEMVRQKVDSSLRKLSHNPKVRAILKGYAQY